MPKHTFDDQTYTQHIQQNSERIEDALQQGKTDILNRPFIKTVVNEAGGIKANRFFWSKNLHACILTSTSTDDTPANLFERHESLPSEVEASLHAS